MEKRRLKVLLIEDDEDDFILVRDLLMESRALDYELEWVATYDEALDEIRRRRHDVYLLDYYLGDRNGLDLLQTAVGEGCSVPIILLTARKDREIDLRAMEAGAADYLVKSLITEDLLERSIRYSVKQKQTEEFLSESEGKFHRLSLEFHTLLDAIPDKLTLLAPDFRILWANRAAAEASGLDVGILKGKRCHEVWHGSSTPCEYCPAKKSFVSGRPENTEVSTFNEQFWNVSTYPILDNAGKVANVIELTTDVTEKIAFQAEAMRAAHLASLGELAAGVAHEVNNPINCVINYAQILANKSRKGTEQNDIANRIIKEGMRIAGIVRGLLSFARERKEEKAPVRVDEVLRDSLALTESILLKQGIRVVVDLPAGLPEIMANSQQIQQVFLNLISNSRYALNEKYPDNHENKVIEIRGKETAPDGRPCVNITFYDRGTGISSAMIEKIMLPFFSTKPTGKGTGLGLCISHGIVNDHGGKIMVHSTEGEWTEVVVSLPAKER